MCGYYSEKLSGERLRRCYEIASPRIQQYLHAEIEFVRNKLNASDFVIEFGCGYGRVMRRISPDVRDVVGIDTSVESLTLARGELRTLRNYHLIAMDASRCGFRDKTFDMVFCVQNGISAFGVNQPRLISEALRVTRNGGKVLFSSYSEELWNDRLEWFRLQSKYGLIGEIDEEVTKNGIIVCKDGFRATTVSARDFRRLAKSLNVTAKVEETDRSSIFFEVVKE
jgi:ubiquinone/menaquinone biosynthesis C-methylase UbiE